MRSTGGNRFPYPAGLIVHFERSCRLREELAAIDPADMRAKIEEAIALARCGRFQEAEGQAETFLEAGEGNPSLLFQAACTVAVCSTIDDAEAARAYRDRTFEVLGRRLASGWKDLGAQKFDHPWDTVKKPWRPICPRAVVGAVATGRR